MVQGVLPKGIWGQGFKGSKSCEIYSGVPDMFWNLQTQTIPNAAPSTLKVLPLLGPSINTGKSETQRE